MAKTRYVIVRAKDTGVFSGLLVGTKDRCTTLTHARRLWYWTGAATLSQLAMEGTTKPKECKFPCVVDEVEIYDTLEVITCTAKAQKSICSVPVWEV